MHLVIPIALAAQAPFAGVGSDRMFALWGDIHVTGGTCVNELVRVRAALRTRIRMTWWMLLAQGILALLIGSLLLTNSEASLRAFAPFLGIYWLVGGLFDILEGLIQRDEHGIWRWSVLGGALAIGAGLLWLSRVVAG